MSSLNIADVLQIARLPLDAYWTVSNPKTSWTRRPPFFNASLREPRARFLRVTSSECDWSIRCDVTEIVSRLEFADRIFRRRQATAGNRSAFAGKRKVSYRRLTTYRLLAEKMDSFIDLFQLREDSRKDNINHHTSLNDGLKILKGTADFMKEIEVQARARTGRRCPQGTDLGFTKPTRDSFQMLHSSFAKIKSILDDKGLLHIAGRTFLCRHEDAE